MSVELNHSNTSFLDDILECIENEDTQRVYPLLEHLPDINAVHPELGIGVIHAAAAIPCTRFTRDLFRNLIKWNVDVNSTTGEGYSPLDIAVSNDRLQTTKFLIKHGAQPTDRTLDLAQEFNNPSCEKLIKTALASLAEGYDTDILVNELKKLGLNPGPITKTTKPLYLRYRERHKLKAGNILTNINKNHKSYSPELELLLSKHGTPDLASILLKYDSLEDQLTLHFQSKHHLPAPKTCFTYLLLNSQVTQGLPKRQHVMDPCALFRTFLDAVFYVGKGTNARPYAHLHEAKVCLEKNLRPKNEKTRKILSLWNDNCGVICLSAFRNVSSEEALGRESAMISALRLDNLTNEIAGASTTRGGLKWGEKQRAQLGSSLLFRALRIHLSEGERPLLHTDV
uniref:Ankyrin repeat and LEM domain-containing protein 1 n=1 Tax=Cacopsylla melanoneura TaxID=428564 RepID=A0A8D8YR47_9HEMI